MITALGKAGKMGAQKTDFPALPSAVTMTLGKKILKKKFKTLPSAIHRALGKEIFKKNKKSLPSVYRVDTRQRNLK